MAKKMPRAGRAPRTAGNQRPPRRPGATTHLGNKALDRAQAGVRGAPAPVPSAPLPPQGAPGS